MEVDIGNNEDVIQVLFKYGRDSWHARQNKVCTRGYANIYILLYIIIFVLGL